MPLGTLLLAGGIGAALLVLLLLRARHRLLESPAGKTLAFIALFVLPAVLLAGGAAHHLEQSKTTRFCLSCHVMEPYGESLDLAASDFLPASHFQNNRIPRERACFTCHTTYAMFGDLRAKVAGARHLLVNYFGTIPEQIELYQPYQNRECLHCHGGARSFEEGELHRDLLAELRRGETSCLVCHDQIHAIDRHSELERWQPAAASAP